jgi:hypothetical protein
VLAGAYRAGAAAGVAVEARGLDSGETTCEGVDAYAAMIRAAAAEQDGLLGLVVVPLQTAKCAKGVSESGVQLGSVISAIQEAANLTSVIAINNNPEGAAYAGVMYVGQNEVQAGREACGALFAAGADEVVFMDYFDRVNPSINGRLEGCEAVAAELEKEVAYVDTPFAEFDANVAKVAAMLRNGTAAKGVLGMGGDRQVRVALGAAEAAGLTPGEGVYVATIDWSSEGVVEAFEAGSLVAVVDQQAPLQGGRSFSSDQTVEKGKFKKTTTTTKRTNQPSLAAHDSKNRRRRACGDPRRVAPRRHGARTRGRRERALDGPAAAAPGRRARGRAAWRALGLPLGLPPRLRRVRGGQGGRGERRGRRGGGVGRARARARRGRRAPRRGGAGDVRVQLCESALRASPEVPARTRQGTQSEAFRL